MGVHDGHRARMKARFVRNGLDNFDDHSVLELLLFYAIPRCDTNETAHRLLKRFGSLQGVLYAAPEELSAVEGIGESAAVLLRLAGDMALRARCSSLPQKVLNSPDRTGAYFMELLAGEKKEMLYQVCLDAKGKPDPALINPLLFAPVSRTYWNLGAPLGKGFALGKEAAGLGRH